ncbi:hypothetical protein BD324DRAFT_675372 [Kockovaella imperatae]|uniref:NAD-dependent epimerase/dehydratase domain-containing protein n=1 Tax=Kockovaella imperatae TaxID=4999 RepID=A0A1Y1UFH4_9TREE|nr:hypothetical protein BD324DRAFT_675372 [Kockovaella imperatae]ORX36772.1 hypothetical protein BD324DRAFT_675372 [Kockovaella imperatae]
MLSRRLASTSAVGRSSSRKIVLVGAGFLASYIAKALVIDPKNRIVLVSRHPEKLHHRLTHLGSQILPPVSYDLSSTNTAPLKDVLKDADAVVSMVGLLSASASQMVEIQQRGAERVLQAAMDQGVKRKVLISAIGSDSNGETPYARTKAAAEKAFLSADPTSTIIRPSIIFGPGDSFFTRFASLAKFLPFLPVFGGGTTKFQPVYAGDVARAVEIACRDDPEVIKRVGGKVIEAGGPRVMPYKEIMKLTLKYSGLEGRRLILSLPYWVGMIQGFFLEKLPESLFTLTRDQVKQLKRDNVVTPGPDENAFQNLLASFPPPGPSSAPTASGANLRSVEESLPTYLGSRTPTESGKRTHGRGSSLNEDQVRQMSKGR